MDNNYEHPTVKIITEYKKKANDSEKLDSLILAYELLIRVDTLILAGLYLKKGYEIKNKLPEKLFKRSLMLGDWYYVFKDLVSTLDIKEAFFISDWFLKMDELGILSKLIELRNKRAHNENRILEKFNSEILDEYQSNFFICYNEHPQIFNFQETESNTLNIQYGKFIISCYPFLLPGALIKDDENILIYKGSSKDIFVYTSIVGKEYYDKVKFQETIKVLKSGISPTDLIEIKNNQYEISSRILDISTKTLSRLEDRNKYSINKYIKRKCLEDMIEEFMDGNKLAMIITGPQGAGKTSWMCDITSSRLKNNEIVFFETSDRFTDLIIPNIFNIHLRVNGNITSSFREIANLSKDKKILLILDDIGNNLKDVDCLTSLFNWIENFGIESRIKLIVTMRKVQLTNFINNYSNSVPNNLVSMYDIPPLDIEELISFAENLPIQYKDKTVDAELFNSRREIAIRISEVCGNSIKRPALTISILNELPNFPDRSSFSEISILKSIYERDIIGGTNKDAPKYSLKSIIVRKLAFLLFTNNKNLLCIDSSELNNVNLLDNNGIRGKDYESLLEDEILFESQENYLFYISFVNPRFYEFITALYFCSENIDIVINKLVNQMDQNPDTLSIAAFYMILKVNEINIDHFIFLHDRNKENLEKIMFEVCMINFSSFQIFMKFILKIENLAINIAKALLYENESQLTIEVCKLILETNNEISKDINIKYLMINAYEYMDDCKNAEQIISTLEDKSRPEIYLKLADMFTTKGLFKEALDNYTIAKNKNCSVDLKASALRGIGYSYFKLNDFIKSKIFLLKSIQLLENTKIINAILAECYCDLGELELESKEIEKAKINFLKSFNINRKIENLAGIGIVEGYIGYCALLDGNYSEANRLLTNALLSARKNRNRWREGWVLLKLSELYRIKEDFNKSIQMKMESEEIYRKIGSVKQ